ncbi:hypothetical protein B0H11DRAFT_513081 [Mycena galericulata]|nr:hypothetical protein B0H11DRAFT_513081 [Mycena galericulata]
MYFTPPSYTSLSHCEVEPGKSHQLSLLRHKECSVLPGHPLGRSRDWNMDASVHLRRHALRLMQRSIMHHLFDSYLNNRTVSGFWTQPKAARLLLQSLSSVMIFYAPSTTSLGDANALLSGPSVMMLPRLNIFFQAPASIAITLAVLISPIITIFPRRSWCPRRHLSFARAQSLHMMNLTTDAILDDFSVPHQRY